MIVQRLVRTAVARVAGGQGLESDLLLRAASWAETEVRSAWRPRPERLTRVRLLPGEHYTVVARPPATRTERRAARRERAAFARHRKLSRPTASQLRAARRLERAQRRAMLARDGSRRQRRAVAAEARLGPKFDRVTTPSPRQARAAAEYESARAELDALRSRSFERARAAGRRARSRQVRVFD